MKRTFGLVAAGVVCATALGPKTSDRPSLELVDRIGRAWTHELVRFERPVDTGTKLVDTDGRSVPYQVVGPQIVFQADVAPFGRSEYRFVPGAPSEDTDLRVTESAETVRVENGRIGIELRRSLAAGEGPIAAIRIGRGRWAGESHLAAVDDGTEYTATVTERGPVLVEVACRLASPAGTWEWRFRMESGEPVVLVDERGSGSLAASLRLDLESLAPTHILHRIGKAPPDDPSSVGAVATWRIADDAEPPFVLVPWLPWWERVREGTWFGLYDESRPDLLMIGARDPGVWVDPDRGPGIPKIPLDRAPSLGLTFPAPEGERRWMLAALDRDTSLAALDAEDRHRAPPPQQLLIKHGDFPLDRVKDYSLAWTGDRGRRPRLYLSRAELRRHRSKFRPDPAELERLRHATVTPHALDRFVEYYLGTGDDALGDNLSRTAVRWMQEAVDRYLRQDEQITLGFAPHEQDRVLVALNLADAVLDGGHLSVVERERLLAQIAFLGYVFERSDYWSPERGFAANPNMTSMVASYRAIVAGSIPGHPRADVWLRDALHELRDVELGTWADRNGGWLEAPHYALVSFDSMLGAFLMAYRASGDDTLFDPRMARVIEWLAKIATPPDDRFRGRRALPPIGNTYVREPSGEFGTVAYLWRKRDPDFSARMQWMQREHGDPLTPGVGGFFPALAGYRNMLRDEDLPARPPAWGSELFPDTGVILRQGFPGPRETRLHLIAGSNHQHYESDSGSITLWGRGRIVADDFGYTHVASGADHSMVVSNRARDAAILHVDAFATQPHLDYVRGSKPGWTREIAFVKDRDDAPSYFVLADTVADPATWRLWLTAERVDLAGSEARARGRDDVDTDLIFVRPHDPRLTTEEKTRETYGLAEDGRYGRVATTQIGVVASTAVSGRFFVVIYPRLRSEPRPVVTALADGRGVRVETPSGTDRVFLAAAPIEAAESDVVFRGTVGLIRTRPGETVLSLGAAGSVRAGARVLEAEESAESSR